MERVFLIDKPEGPSSHDLVDRVRRSLGIRRVGHTGTLDPFASGLLLVLTGKATRLAEVFREHDKRYQGTVCFGSSTETDDREGAVLESLEDFTVDRDALHESILDLASRKEQRVPLYSAIKIDGVPLYKRVRRGEKPEAPVRPVLIHDIRLLEQREREVDLEVHCASGTYIRSLARDLGEILGIPSHLSSLRRNAAGPFSVKDAVSIESIEESGFEAGRPLGLAFASLPSARVSGDFLPRFLHGEQPRAEQLQMESPLPEPGTWMRFLGEGDALLALGRVEMREEGPALRLRRMLEA
ncbi:MAG: tRNA pseudouridine(55) synthase TruB [Candidatus Krumholzibacteria bacterium]|nr:tRNA pseudouridine(55) synthase TruB [Candidatus Krumholzibacteria bacterium]